MINVGITQQAHMHFNVVLQFLVAHVPIYGEGSLGVEVARAVHPAGPSPTR